MSIVSRMVFYAMYTSLVIRKIGVAGGALLGHLQNGAPKGTESEDVRCQRRVAGKW